MSDKLIDFKTALMERGADKQFVLTAPDGSKWFKYTAVYQFQCDKGWGLPEYILKNPNAVFPEAEEYSIEFWAQNDEDAEQRVQAMVKTLKLEGRILEEQSL